MLLLPVNSIHAQNRNLQTITVEGIVVDESNTPMSGIKVGVQEKNIVETTGEDGRFYMLILPNEVLVVDEKGYYPVVEPVAGISNHTLTLVKYRKGEETLVPVAYGEQTQRNTTSAISSLSSSAAIEKNSLTSIEQAMEGTLSGLYSIRNSGEKFGRSNIDFYVRGKSTLGNARPLILVDGMEFNVELIDFCEVENVTVLKDAVALAMYGMRGANGVILIQTKRGSELKTTINLDVRGGVQQAVYIADRLNAFQYTSMYNEALKNDGSSLMFNPSIYQNAERDTYLYPDEDFKNLFLGSISPFQHYNFTASGGNNIAKYFVLASYLSQEGIFKDAENNNQYNRFNFRTNIDVNLFKGFQMNVLISAAIDKNKSPYSGSTSTRDVVNSTFNSIITLPANAFPVFNRNGSLGGTSEYKLNPYGLLNRSGYREDETRMLNALIKGKYDFDRFVKGLSADAFYGFENYNMQYTSVYHKYAVYQEAGDGTYTQFGEENNKNTREAGLMGGFYRYTTLGAAANYERIFSTDHEFSGKLQYQHSIETVPGDNPDYKYQSLALRAHYGFKKKYYAELTAAYQGSTNYRKGKRSGLFPAVGLSWISSDEDFLRSSETITFLKLRASYGLNGNDQTGGQRFAYRDTYSKDGGYGFGVPNGSSDSSREGALASENDTWEKAYKANVGFDLEIGKNISITLDYFNEQRNDILVAYSNSVPSLIGIEMQSYNAGKIKNQGIDGNIQYTKQYKNGGFHIGGNFLWAKNKILDIKEIQYEYAHQYRKGYSIDTRFGYESSGFYLSQEQLTGAPAASFGIPELGNLVYKNQNPEDDNIIDDRDKVALGSSFPELIYGISIGGDFKGFDIHCNMRGSELFSTHFIPAKFSVYSYENRWTPENPGQATDYPRLSVNSNYNQQTSDFWESRTHLFRITSIELGYSIPENLTKKMHLNTIRIYLNANNPLSLYNVKDNRDPEALNAGYSQYPALRTFTLGLNVKL